MSQSSFGYHFHEFLLLYLNQSVACTKLIICWNLQIQLMASLYFHFTGERKILTHQTNIMLWKVMHSCREKLTMFNINFLVQLTFNKGRCHNKPLKLIKIYWIEKERRHKINKQGNQHGNDYKASWREITNKPYGCQWELNRQVFLCSRNPVLEMFHKQHSFWIICSIHLFLFTKASSCDLCHTQNNWIIVTRSK